MINFIKALPAVSCLLLINVAAFLATLTAGPNANLLIYELGLFYFDSPMFSPYQLVTHLFMHGGIAHIAFNMFALLMFGSQLEIIWGWRRFIIFYMITGFGAVLLHQLVQAYEIYQIAETIRPATEFGLKTGYQFAGPFAGLNEKYFAPVVGASGAVFGLLMGYGVLFPNVKMVFLLLPIPIKAKYIIPLMMGLELFLGVRQFSMDNIAHFAHIGGALFGFILVRLWKNKTRMPPPIQPSNSI